MTGTAMAFLLLAGLSAALIPVLRGRLHPVLVVAVAVAGGSLLAAVAFRMTELTGLPSVLVVLLMAAVTGASGIVLRQRAAAQSGPVFSMAPAQLWERLATYGIWATLGFILLVYLWSNAFYPPSLYATLLEWSGPARTGEPIQGFAHSLSGFYYQFADSDLGWKLFWSLLGLLPWMVLYGGLRDVGARPLVAVIGVGGPAASVSALFWASTGYPDLFLGGLLLLLFFLAVSSRDGARWMMAVPVLALLWSGSMWIALGGLMLLAGVMLHRVPVARRGLVLAMGLAPVAYWAWSTSFEWQNLSVGAAYLAWDALSVGRYGIMAYLMLGILLRYGRWAHLPALLAGVVAPLFLVFLEVTARQGMEFALLVRMDGSRLLTVALMLGWAVALVTMHVARPIGARDDRGAEEALDSSMEQGNSPLTR